LFGAVLGAEYAVEKPLGVLVGETVPQPGEQLAPFCDRVQKTPRLAGSFMTVPVNLCVLPTTTVAEVGETETETGGVTVTMAETVLVVSVTDVAVTVTVAGLGTLLGAV